MAMKFLPNVCTWLSKVRKLQWIMIPSSCKQWFFILKYQSTIPKIQNWCVKRSDLHISPTSTSVIIRDGFGGRRICLTCILQFKVSDLHISPTSTSVIIQDGFGGRRICLTCILPLKISDLHISLTSTSAIILDECGGRHIRLNHAIVVWIIGKFGKYLRIRTAIMSKPPYSGSLHNRPQQVPLLI